MLAGTPNSNRCVELEVANRFLRDFNYSHTDLPNIDVLDIPTESLYGSNLEYIKPRISMVAVQLMDKTFRVNLTLLIVVVPCLLMKHVCCVHILA